MNKKISIIYSFRNESPVLEELLNRTIEALSGFDYEIIFVDDNSDDGSNEFLLEKCKKNNKIKIITMSSRFGQAQCLIAGLRQMTGDVAIYCDADLQDSPELFKEMILSWENGAEVVNMVRTKRRGENFLKMILTRSAYLIWNKCSKINIQVEVGDFKLLDKKVVEKLCALREEDPFLRGYVQWLGYKQVNLPYCREARSAGKSHFPFFGGDPIETFLIGLTSFSITPLYITIPAFIIAVMESILYLFFQNEFNIWLYLVALLLNLQFLCLAVISIYIGRIHFQSRRRPLYNIRSTINLKDPEK